MNTVTALSNRSPHMQLSGLIGLIVLVTTWLVINLNTEYQNTERHAQDQMGNLTRLLEEHVLATVGKTDLLLHEVQRNVRPEDMRIDHSVHETRQQALHALLKSQVDSAPEVAAAFIADAQGNHIYSSVDPLPRINVADRYYFQRHRDDATAGLVMPPPHISRTTDKWTLVLSRRLAFADGRFAGIITIILNLDYFQQFYNSLSLGQRGVVALYDREFHLAARYPLREKEMGQKIPNLNVQPLLDQGLTHGTYRGTSPLDGIERLFSFRQVDGLPLLVFAGTATDDYLAEWRQHAWQTAIGLIIFGVMILGFGWRQLRSQEGLRAASLYGRSLIEASLDPLVTIGADGKIMDVNAATEKVTGWVRDQLIGSDFADYFIDPEQARRGYQQVFSQGQVTDYPLAIRHASGKVTEVLYNASVYRDAQGKVAGVLAAARDITTRTLIEQELQRSNADLEQFAYAISHDMRQPLRMVGSYLQLIEKALRDRLDDDTRQYMTYAREGAERMDGMILALLDFSRVGRKSDPMSPLEVRTALDEALAFLGPELTTSGGTVTVSGDWPSLIASRDEMLRLFQNLVGNALKYHEVGQPPRVAVCGSLQPTVWRCEVRDQGIGIDPAQSDRLFKVFSRLQARSRFDGAGVGLALCRKIVEHHHGNIGVVATGESQGSTFWFELPLGMGASSHALALELKHHE